MGTLHTLSPMFVPASLRQSAAGQPTLLERPSGNDRRRFLDRCTEQNFRPRVRGDIPVTFHSDKRIESY